MRRPAPEIATVHCGRSVHGSVHERLLSAATYAGDDSGFSHAPYGDLHATGGVHNGAGPTALDELARSSPAGWTAATGCRSQSPGALPLLATDPGLLEGALAILVANALRYSPPGRPPTLTAEAVGDTVTVSVIDHGTGFAPDQRERVFEPFQQLGDQHAAGGVGLGFAVAKGFIDVVGGRIPQSQSPAVGRPCARTYPLPHRLTTQPAPRRAVTYGEPVSPY